MTDDLSREEKRLNALRQEQGWRKGQRKVLATAAAMRERCAAITPLERPRPEYVDVDTAASLADCEPKVIKLACDKGELDCRRPRLHHRLILKEDLWAWIRATGRD
jgi:hypothetical protein